MEQATRSFMTGIRGSSVLHLLSGEHTGVSYLLDYVQDIYEGGPVVVVVVFFTLTDRASTIPNNTRGCQSGTWSAGQKKIRGTSTKLQ